MLDWLMGFHEANGKLRFFLMQIVSFVYFFSYIFVCFRNYVKIEEKGRGWKKENKECE